MSIVQPGSDDNTRYETRTHQVGWPGYYSTKRLTAEQVRIPSGHASVYRLWRWADLLYIGATERPWTRFQQHAGSKPWWWEVTTITQVVVPSRGVALALEDEAIRTELPLYNRTGPWNAVRKSVQRKGLPVVLDELVAQLGLPA